MQPAWKGPHRSEAGNLSILHVLVAAFKDWNCMQGDLLASSMVDFTQLTEHGHRLNSPLLAQNGLQTGAAT